MIQSDCVLDFDAAYFLFFSSLGSVFLNSIGLIVYKGAFIKNSVYLLPNSMRMEIACPHYGTVA